MNNKGIADTLILIGCCIITVIGWLYFPDEETKDTDNQTTYIIEIKEKK
ncbi:hypothetical protein KAR91_31325 [Candidatus Pacearchaeota archaeon]|nr:hypothetical protein [Candidatus Pacearchaeota archaeon]